MGGERGRGPLGERSLGSLGVAPPKYRYIPIAASQNPPPPPSPLQLLHSAAAAVGGFAWLADDIFDLPFAHSVSVGYSPLAICTL